ncbi:hypothetical protein PY257_13245 [Ramlibacter sp. H39-3-26]|uniref:hypothetical protein n=1 Tax=Curvibacter soli TaxID=3031331 RepID=UPI0023DBF10D|nr:hypothetical protein [Ramlibacter sp. H39-3-26]MDF1486134.1 hypothetical protein [Ramlibacter sp. H39-3-26]
MMFLTPTRSTVYAPLLFCAAALLGAAAHAAPGDAAQQRYRLYRQDCLRSQSQESQAACLHEAEAALQAERAGQLAGGDAATYERNALQRCAVFKSAEDRSDCRARMSGGGTTSGSVEGGGLLREAVTPLSQ